MNIFPIFVHQLNEALEAARVDVNRLHAEREKYEETMKKAFMRGVCALNMEAMTMFHEEQGNIFCSKRELGFKFWMILTIINTCFRLSVPV